MKVKLWTLLEEKGWQELQTKGVFKGKAEFVEPDFKEAYDWMKVQMKKRIGPPKSNDQYPVWAWYQYINEKKKRPDLRSTSFLPTGTKGYRVEIEKEEKDVLLSDFQLWDSPLSYKYFIANSESECLKFEAEMNQKFGTDSFSKLPVKIRAKIEKSWEKIFDMNFEVEYFTKPFKYKLIQATYWELNKNEIVKVDKFTAR